MLLLANSVIVAGLGDGNAAVPLNFVLSENYQKIFFLFLSFLSENAKF